MTKDKVMSFATMLPYMDPEVAKKALEQFPSFKDLAGDMVTQYKATVTPGLGEVAPHNSKVTYSMDFQVTPHQLRHIYITNLIYAQVDPKTVQYLAGYENSKISMDIYAKVKYNKPKELAAVVNGAFGQ